MILKCATVGPMAARSTRISNCLTKPTGIRKIVSPCYYARSYATQANDVEHMLQHKTLWEAYPYSIRKLAVFAEHARSNNYQIPLLSKAQTVKFDQSHAYHIAAAIRQLRAMSGEVVAGRKLGFTNKNIWPKYSVSEPNWSYLYQSTVVDLPGKGELSEGKVVLANISHLSALEPKIEPEIIFGLRAPVDAGMSDVQLLNSIDWISHGFEIVQSVFPLWKFTAADATAAFAMHGLLLVGPRAWLHRDARTDDSWLDDLQSFEVELFRNGEKVDQGSGRNVLGSPINALRHLLELLAKDEYNKPLETGEIVTTGTLTKALPISDGDFWSTKLRGIALPGLDVKFQIQ